MRFKLWPYEELEVKQGKANFTYIISTPWRAAEITVSSEGKKLLDRMAPIVSANPMPAEMAEDYSTVFQDFIDKPYSYILPRLALPLADIDAAVPSICREDCVFEKMHSQWDRNGALDLARLPNSNRYDPLTLFSVFRRFYFLDSMEFDKTRKLFEELESIASNENLFPTAAAFLASQTLYITQRCDQALRSALPLSGSDPRLITFIESERGHDNLMQKAVHSITQRYPVPDEWLKPHKISVGLMDELEYLGKTNLISFAFALSLFEESPDSKNQAANLMFKGKLEEAGKMYEKHQAINDHNDHDRIGFDLVTSMGSISKDYAELAMDGAQNIAGLMNNYSNELLKELTPLLRSN